MKISLEVVDNKLKTIKKETYDNIHKFGLLHKAVHNTLLETPGVSPREAVSSRILSL